MKILQSVPLTNNKSKIRAKKKKKKKINSKYGYTYECILYVFVHTLYIYYILYICLVHFNLLLKVVKTIKQKNKT